MERIQNTFWRDDAINAALLSSAAGDGSSQDAVLCAIRRARPQNVVLSKWLDRASLQAFLKRHTVQVRRLLRGNNLHTGYGDDDALHPSFDWMSLRWQDTPLELALAPSGANGWAYLFGPPEDVLIRLSAALDDWTRRPLGRALRYSSGWNSAPDIDAELGRVTWDDIILAPPLMAQVRGAVESFFAHREAFAALGFAWKRGILLIGPPGTGKTMVCKAAAAACPDLPFLYVRDLRERGQTESVQAIFERARLLAPCILAFEDMDGFITPGNRTVFLNEMDGFGSNDGLLIIASSNHPGRIDEALLRRPSRFDRVFHIGLPAPAERAAFCLRLLGCSPLAAYLSSDVDVTTLANLIADATDGFTPAFLKEVFVSAALERAQEGALVLDTAFQDAVLGQAAEMRAHIKRLKDPDALVEMASSDVLGFRS